MKQIHRHVVHKTNMREARVAGGWVRRYKTIRHVRPADAILSSVCAAMWKLRGWMKGRISGCMRLDMYCDRLTIQSGRGRKGWGTRHDERDGEEKGIK